jgi:hypothetical protein
MNFSATKPRDTKTGREETRAGEGEGGAGAAAGEGGAGAAAGEGAGAAAGEGLDPMVQTYHHLELVHESRPRFSIILSQDFIPRNFFTTLLNIS